MSLIETEIFSSRRPFQVEAPVLSPEIKTQLDAMPLPPLRTRTARCGYIGVMGRTLCVGKTTATEALREILIAPNVVVFPERWQENPYLTDPSQRIKSEFFFLTANITANREIQARPEETVVIEDVPFEMDYLYALTDRAIYKITEDEWQIYQSAYKAVVPKMVTPDLIVFIKCGNKEVSQRVKARGREFEQDQQKRIGALSCLSSRWEKEVQGKIPILTVDSGELDFTIPMGRIELARRVVRKLEAINPQKFGHLDYFKPGLGLQG